MTGNDILMFAVILIFVAIQILIMVKQWQPALFYMNIVSVIFLLYMLFNQPGHEAVGWIKVVMTGLLILSVYNAWKKYRAYLIRRENKKNRLY